MDYICINLSFLFNFWLLGRFFCSKNGHFRTKIEKRRSELTLVIFQPPRKTRVFYTYNGGHIGVTTTIYCGVGDI